jgi:hypothetical protein
MPMPEGLEKLLKKVEKLPPPSQCVDCSEFKKKYDEQVCILYNETNDPAENVKYRLIEKDTGKILAEGKTDKQGLTERVSTDKPEDVDIVVILPKQFSSLNQDIREENYSGGTCKTNNTNDSCYMAKISKQYIFFDIHYIVNDKAFERAAKTERRLAKKDRFKMKDIWLSYAVKSESEFKEAWRKVYAFQQKYGLEIQEGHIYSHSDLSLIGTGKAGLEFRPGMGEDGTLTYKEIAALEVLQWSKTSRLFLYGCRSGRIDGKEDISIADAFFATQDTVKQVSGLRDFGYFSSDFNKFVEISTDFRDSSDVYLWSYWIRRNVPLYPAAMPSGDTDRMSPYIISR